MSTTFMTSPQLFFTSESVTEGHPDKICDQISDAVLDAIYKEDPMGRVACETAITTGLVCVMGEITTNTYVDIATIARETIKDIGYTRASSAAISSSSAPSKTEVTARKPSRDDAQPRCVSKIWPIFIRAGTPSGLRII